ncbi:MAG: tetratricopeptide repeat protein [Maricaulaceae bacterium]|jgi:tetratricopeptide (TPR) repeat protein
MRRAARPFFVAIAAAAAAAGMTALAGAQDPDQQPDQDPLGRTPQPVEPSPEFGLPPIEPVLPDIRDQWDSDIVIGEDAQEPVEEEEEPQLTREERLDALFVELAGIEEDAEAAFVAEEIEAIWRDSGSPTVDLLTDRATDALDLGEVEVARELIDGALELGPEHAEAWAQSAQIAMIEEEFGLALEHIEQAVIYEPRHYLALTRLGLILERLGSAAGAYDAYQRALELNPRLPGAVAGAERTEREGRGRDL